MTDIAAAATESGEMGSHNTLFDGPGEMRALCRLRDWAATPLGPVASWPVSLFGDDGVIAGVLVSCHETTARMRAEREQTVALERLSNERALLREVFRQTPAFMVLLNGPDHVFEFANDAYYQLVGHRELLGKPLFEAVPDARDQGFEALLRDVLTTGNPFVGRALPVRLNRTPGAPPEERFIDLTYTPMKAANGPPTGIIVHGVDVTDQVRARERLVAAEQQLRTLADAIPTLA